MTFKQLLLMFAVLSLGGRFVSAQSVRIGVFGLFHPHDLKLEAPPGKAIIVHTDHRSFVLERSSGLTTARVRSSGDNLLLQADRDTVSTRQISVTSRAGGQVEFVLLLPKRIRRRYIGTLELMSVNGALVPIITTDIETAVASAVEAESGPQTPPEALKAQAIAARSYMVAARGRHGALFDFCDTTHCQYLREPPARGSPADIATRSTKDLVLAYEGEPFAAMFTRSCSGETRTPEQDGYRIRGYPYFSVTCYYCRTHPHRWESRVSPADAKLLARKSEAARLAIGRSEGWDAVPGDDFTLRVRNGQIMLEGSGEGHGIGLCQRGARAMSESGADFRKILEHYFPDTAIIDYKFERNSPGRLPAAK